MSPKKSKPCSPSIPKKKKSSVWRRPRQLVTSGLFFISNPGPIVPHTDGQQPPQSPRKVAAASIRSPSPCVKLNQTCLLCLLAALSAPCCIYFFVSSIHQACFSPNSPRWHQLLLQSYPANSKLNSSSSVSSHTSQGTRASRRTQLLTTPTPSSPTRPKQPLTPPSPCRSALQRSVPPPPIPLPHPTHRAKPPPRNSPTAPPPPSPASPSPSPPTRTSTNGTSP